MSKIVNGAFVIEEEPYEKCQLCGKMDELRPYGPNGENVCFDCAMKDKAAAQRQFAKRIAGKPVFHGGELIK